MRGKFNFENNVIKKVGIKIVLFLLLKKHKILHLIRFYLIQ